MNNSFIGEEIFSVKCYEKKKYWEKEKSIFVRKDSLLEIDESKIKILLHNVFSSSTIHI